MRLRNDLSLRRLLSLDFGGDFPSQDTLSARQTAYQTASS